MFLTKEKRHGDTPPMSLLCSKVDAIEWKSRTRGVFWAGGGGSFGHILARFQVSICIGEPESTVGLSTI